MPALDIVETGTYFKGTIWEGGMWDVALTTAEILSLSKGASPLLVRPDRLFWYCPFIRGADADGGGELRDFVAGTTLTEQITTPYAVPHRRVIYPTAGRIVLGDLTAVAAGSVNLLQGPIGLPRRKVG